MMPGMSGFDVCKRVRSMGNSTPIILLTAKGEEIDKVIGLELGADDYLTKPFHPEDLKARVGALLRRSAGHAQPVIELGPLKIDHGKRKVEVRGEAIQLTVKEYDLLHTLAARPGRTFSRRQLLDLVWDQNSDIYEHTVNSHINRLRNKIENLLEGMIDSDISTFTM